LYQEDKDDNITEVTGVISGKGSSNLDEITIIAEEIGIRAGETRLQFFTMSAQSIG
jgi:hypothetical protein